MKSEIILIGAGGHARSCIDVIEGNNSFRIAGLVGAPEELETLSIGYEVIGTDGDLATLVERYRFALIALGQIKTAEHRIRLYCKVKQLGFEFPTIIASTAYVSKHAKIGSGTIVMHGAVVNAGAVIGENCIINSRALIEHNVVIGDHCHISTGAILNGDVTVGAKSFIGSGSIVMQGVSIGDACVVGLGVYIRHALVNGEYIRG